MIINFLAHHSLKSALVLPPGVAIRSSKDLSRSSILSVFLNGARPPTPILSCSIEQGKGLEGDCQAMLLQQHGRPGRRVALQYIATDAAADPYLGYN